MKIVHLKALGAALAISTLMAGTAHAQIASATSDPSNVLIDTSTVVGGPHSAGKVGIHVPNLTSTQYVDFYGLQTAVAPVNGITSIAAVTGTITDHSQFGRFDFGRVGTQDLYFGEWKQTANVAAGDHTVYYGGTGASSSVPNSGGATYTVKGVSDFQTNGALNGTFTAAFTGGGSGTLSGSITNVGSTYTVNIGTATISGPAFFGTGASATGTSASGVVQGQFFGSNVDALAGIVTFSGAREHDTAFGGTKN
jgi:hypothetical protein